MTELVKWGSEFLVNTTTVRSQSGSMTSALADGRFIIIWHDYSNTGEDQSYSAVRAQIFNADGSPSGDEFVVNTTTEGTQMPGAVTLLPDGRFVVVWQYDTLNYYVGYEIVAQIFNPDGTKSGPEFIVNTEYLLEQTDPKIATLADGRFVVTWRDSYVYPYETGDDTSVSVKAQIFNADGTPVGTEFLVNTTTVSTQENAEVVGLRDGRFVVVWQDYSATGGDHLSYDVRAQVFNADGSKAGGEIFVNTTTVGQQFYPTIAALTDGGFAVAWWHDNQTTWPWEDKIFVQIFNADGTTRGDEFVVHTTDMRGHTPAMTALPNGQFVVVWAGGTPEGVGTGSDIWAQVFNADGSKAGDQLLVNTTVTGMQGGPTVAALGDGRFVVSWDDTSPSSDDPSEYAVRAQIVDPRSSAVSFEGTAAGDQYGGTVFGDTLNGHAGADVLFGADGNDALDGGEDDDMLDGGGGADVLLGGAGLDTVSYARAVSGVTVSLATGVGARGDAEGDTLTGVENLIGSAFDDSLTGDAGANVLTGKSGNDVLTGLDGDDILAGEAGADQLDGGAGTDVASYASSAAAVIANLSTATGSNGDAAGDTFAGIEGLAGSAFADTLIGDGNANLLAGGAGNDLLDGSAGSDTLEGGEGDDLLVGSSEADRLRGGAGSDTAVYSAAAAAVVVSLAAGTGSGSDAQGDTLVEVENIVGSAFADVLTGDANANTLTGGGGGDRLEGGAGSDTASYVTAGSAVTVSLATGGGAGSDAQGDVLISIENLTGSAFNDTLVGDNNANVLAGGDGADQLNAGGGVDTASYSDSTAAVTVSLMSGTGSGGAAEGDVLVQIENITGSAFNDTLTGNDLANVLVGGDGNDVINAGSGDDFLVGGAGNDDLIGGDGVDTLSYAGAAAGVNIDLHFTGSRQDGGDGLDQLSGDIENLIGSAFDDALVGNDAANVLDGGAGDDEIWATGADDRLIGGAGNDFLSGSGYGTTTFVFGANSGHDLVSGFTPKAQLPSYLPHDVIEIDPSVLPDFAAVMAAATEDEYGNTTITLSDSSSIVLWSVSKQYLSADDFLFAPPGTEGNDTLLSTSGNDTLNGGSGIDTASYATAPAGVTINLAIAGPQNTIGAGTDTLVSIENLVGSAFNDNLFGTIRDNVLTGGAGNDRLTGLEGRDTLTGGLGSDVFDFNETSDSEANAITRDVITDFQPGVDRIDLSTIDANWWKSGNQSFRFIGTDDFTMRPGELRYEIVDQAGTANDRTIIYGDIEGNGSSDFQIELVGLHTLSSRDFIL